MLFIHLMRRKIRSKLLKTSIVLYQYIKLILNHYFTSFHIVCEKPHDTGEPVLLSASPSVSWPSPCVLPSIRTSALSSASHIAARRYVCNGGSKCGRRHTLVGTVRLSWPTCTLPSLSRWPPLRRWQFLAIRPALVFDHQDLQLSKRRLLLGEGKAITLKPL